MEEKVLVIGGGAAGFTAALSARKFNRKAGVTLIAKEKEFYSRCSLPFVISGEIENFERVFHDIIEMCENVGINCVVDEVTKISPQEKKVKAKQREFSYSSLIIATGSEPCIPPIEGVKREGVFTLKSLEDGGRILDYVGKVKKAVVIGGGAIGVEIASALWNLDLEVTIVELLPCLLPTCFSPDSSEKIKERLKKEKIKVVTKSSVEKILGKKKVSGVLVEGKEIPCQMVVIGAGVKPNVKLAQEVGMNIEKEGIKVNERMETSLPGIFAAGDCTCFKNLITGKPMPSQLGTTAIRQGKVAGVNAVGGNEKLEGVLNSLVLKILDLEVGKTGLNEKEAKEEGFSTVMGKIKTTTREDYYPGTKDLWVKLIFNPENEKILGGEIIGGEGVAEKMDLISFAIQKNSTIEDLLKLDYCYTPPIISAHNALVLAAENAQRKLKIIRRRG